MPAKLLKVFQVLNTSKTGRPEVESTLFLTENMANTGPISGWLLIDISNDKTETESNQ